ncbi:MAG: hypothetical protein KDN20_05240 [Verrucomicrobiae bacterium]|nr:hypothetical protein [Verrucomicrobiae bacterium]
MKKLTFAAILSLTLIAAFSSITGCNSVRSASSDGLFQDPDTKRLQMQEDMTKRAREISENY